MHPQLVFFPQSPQHGEFSLSGVASSERAGDLHDFWLVAHDSWLVATQYNCRKQPGSPCNLESGAALGCAASRLRRPWPNKTPPALLYSTVAWSLINIDRHAPFRHPTCSSRPSTASPSTCLADLAYLVCEDSSACDETTTQDCLFITRQRRRRSFRLAIRRAITTCPSRARPRYAWSRHQHLRCTFFFRYRRPG